MNKICGIYRINSPTHKIYVGQSKNIMERMRQYKTGWSKGQILLHRSICKYGWENHKFEIVCECEENELNDLEIFYIKKFDSFNNKNGLNLTSGGNSPKLSDETKKKIGKSKLNNKYWVGRKHSDETKNKLRIINKGKKLSDEHKKKIGAAMSKRKLSDEHKRKIGLGNKGNKLSDETKKKISVASKRKVFTDDYRKKLSVASKGRKHSNETKNKLRIINKGKVVSAESKEKMSISKKGNHSKASYYEIYNSENELVHSFYNHFIVTMKTLKFPPYSFQKSYQQQSKIKSGDFKNWYAIKISK